MDFSVRLCVVRKPLRNIFLRAKIFARKKTQVREEKEKKKQLLRNHVPVDWIFCSISSLVKKSKIKWQLTKRNFLSQFKNILLSLTKVTWTFTPKKWRKIFGKRLPKNWVLKMVSTRKIDCMNSCFKSLFIFSVFASSSPSPNNKDNCKMMMLVNRRHFENNEFISWSCFYLEPQLSRNTLSTNKRKYEQNFT